MEAFTLKNDEPRRKAKLFGAADPEKQSVLFAGMDCCPGQLDLFKTDGAPALASEQQEESGHGLDPEELLTLLDDLLAGDNPRLAAHVSELIEGTCQTPDVWVIDWIEQGRQINA